MIIALFIFIIIIIIIYASLENMTFNFSCSIGDILLYFLVAAVTLLFTDVLQLGVQRLHDTPKSVILRLKVIWGVSFYFLHSAAGEESISFYSIILTSFLKLLAVEDNTGSTNDFVMIYTKESNRASVQRFKREKCDCSSLVRRCGQNDFSNCHYIPLSRRC